MDTMATLGWATAFVASAGLCWQVWACRRSARRACECELALAEQHQLAQRMTGEHRELTAAVRAERAHVEQLQRKIGFFRDQTALAQASLEKVVAQLIEAQREGGLSGRRYAQVLEAYLASRGNSGR